ncbi:MAG: CdaR family protein [Acidobacteriota bacterium]
MAAFPFRNVGLKVLSICIAGLLWLVVAGDRVVERALRVPLEFENLPPGLEILGDPAETVDVRLRGPSGAFARVAQGELAAVIDLRTARPGRRLFSLTTGHLRLPYGIEAVTVSPSTVPIAFENAAVRVLPVRPSIEGQPADGYEVRTVIAEPTSVEVIGPESALRRLDEAMTEPVSVTNATGRVHEVVTVGVADSSVRLRTPQTAVVTVQIMPGSTLRTFAGVPVSARNVGEGLHARLAPDAISVDLRGTEAAVRLLNTAGLDAHVDASGLAPGDYTLDVKVVLPNGLAVVDVTPPALRVRVSRSQ